MKPNFNLVRTADAHRLRRQWQKLRHIQNPDEYQQHLHNFNSAYQRSHQHYLQRQEALPAPNLQQHLPVYQHREALLEALQQHQVVIVCGETGSGKTTQLPQLCLQLGWGARGTIAHTQPRRLAARSVAARLAEELNVPLGAEVGYQVRFEDKTSPQTIVKLMTDGVLLAETMRDPFLNQYEAIIIDEAHERSLNIDFLLGYVRRLLDKRRDLKIIITSATIDAEQFSRHFKNAPIVSVSGRSYPVQIEYQEPLENEDLPEQVLRAVEALDGHQRGDILVFLATEREITECQKVLSRAELPQTEILPLFGRLSLAAQQEIFQPKQRRRIVLSTNVAETSLTVPRIRYVIDGGMARISRYSLRSKTQRLPIEAISQASANQRTGRCGRLSAGVCIRLYSAEDFATRPAFTEPEILRTNLAAVILQMLVLKLGDVADFPFLDAPDSRQINDGYRLLYELQAVDAQNRLTPLGRKMALLPIDPRFARIVFAAEKNASLHEALIVLAFLSLQDPRERPFGQEALAEQRQAVFVDTQSDIQTILNLFWQYQKQRHELGSNALRRWCQHYFLNPLRMKEWRELLHQLIQESRAQKMKLNELKLEALPERIEGSKGSLGFSFAGLNNLHEALLSGFLDQIGLWDEQKQDYLSTRGRRFRIFPASGLAKRKIASVMAASIVETQQVFARYVAPMDLFVVERLAAHLCKRQLRHPHWSKKMGNVMAEETVTLYGLPLISGRKKPFASENPVLAHRIFIEEALLTGEIQTRLKVIADNQRLLAELEDLEDRSRSRNVVDEQKIADFYFQRLPESVHSVVTLEQWAKKNGESALKMSATDVMQSDAPTQLEGYPDHLRLHGYRLPLQYAFNPGEKADGVTVLLPLTALNAVQESDFERLVPAMLLAKVEALLRRLPKVYRRQLVPIPETAKLIFPMVESSTEALLTALTQALQQHKKIDIPAAAWTQEALEAHHLMNIRLLDGEKIVAESRDLSALQAQFSERAADIFQQRSSHSTSHWFEAQENVRDWHWENVPAQETLRGGIVAYPALTRDGEALHWRHHDQKERAEALHREGLLFLLQQHLNQEIKYLRKNLPDLSRLQLQYHSLQATSTSTQYFDDLMAAAILSCALKETLPRSQSAWNQALAEAKKHLIPQAQQWHQQLKNILQAFSDINTQCRSLKNSPAKNDMQQQLQSLVYHGFIRQTAAARFQDLERYLKAILRRIEKFKHEPLKDFRAMEALLPWQNALEIKDKPAWRDYFWLLQEYRVQLFAQELGTAQKVSPQRLEALLAAVKKT